MKNNTDLSPKSQLLIVRIAAFLVFLILNLSTILIILYPNPAYPIYLRAIVTCVLFILAFLGGRTHGTLERIIKQRAQKSVDHNNPV